jgi:F0F1-type ATP synthase assembly protein I
MKIFEDTLTVVYNKRVLLSLAILLSISLTISGLACILFVILGWNVTVESFLTGFLSSILTMFVMAILLYRKKTEIQTKPGVEEVF